jgi:hypothetical protein
MYPSPNNIRLLDLEPRWLTPNLFIFRNPWPEKKRLWWLSCKNITMTIKEQRLLFEQQPEDASIVYTRPDYAWQFPPSGDFAKLTVHPSIDASAGRMWHGFIKNGLIE